MKYEFKRYVWAASLVLALPLLALAALVNSSSGKNGKFDWFTVGTQTGNIYEHTITYGVNDDGTTVGTYELGTGEEHGFVTKDKGKNIYAINYSGACATDVGAINDEGVIAGTYEKRTGPCPFGGSFDDFGFKYKDGKFEKLNVPKTAKFKTTLANCNKVGGTYSAPKCTVTVHFLDVRGISYDEDVVGGFSPATGDLGFVLTKGADGFRVLEVCNDATISNTTLTPAGCAPGTTDGWGINDEYTVVGHYEDLVPGPCAWDEGFYECENHHHGFIWTKEGEEGGFKKLYCDGDPLTNTDANAINDDGVIAGRCDSKAFVLFPPYRDSDWHQFSIPDLELVPNKFPPCPTGMELNKTVAWGISEDKIAGSYTCEKPNFNPNDPNDEKSYSFTVKIKDVL